MNPDLGTFQPPESPQGDQEPRDPTIELEKGYFRAQLSTEATSPDSEDILLGF